MHHSLRIYSKYREFFLKYYIWQAEWTKIPMIGRLVRKVANLYGNRASAAYLLTLQEANEIVDNAAGLAIGPCADSRSPGTAPNPASCADSSRQGCRRCRA